MSESTPNTNFFEGLEERLLLSSVNPNQEDFGSIQTQVVEPRFLQSQIPIPTPQVQGIIDALQENPAFVSYAPSKWNPDRGQFPTKKTIRKDLANLQKAGFMGIVTYSLENTLAEIPRIAKEMGFEHVVAGLFYYNDETLQKEIQAAHAQLEHIDAFRLGSEGIFTRRYTINQLSQEIESLKESTGKPVFTSEPEHIYFQNPQLLEIGDIVFPNIHPWWANVPVEQAANFTKTRYDLMKLQTDTPIVISETWWPAKNKGEQLDQARYFEDLERKDIPFVQGEAFDQPWKKHHEVPKGGKPIGDKWGLFSKNGKPKQYASELDLSDYSGIATQKGSKITIEGTTKDDTIIVDGRNVQINNQHFKFPKNPKLVIVYGNDGDDYIDISKSGARGQLYGERGIDTLIGGPHQDLIMGGEGLDLIVGNGSNKKEDQLYQGDENDSLSQRFINVFNFASQIPPPIGEEPIPPEEPPEEPTPIPPLDPLFHVTFDDLESITNHGGAFRNSSYEFVPGVEGNALHLNDSNYLNLVGQITKHIPEGSIELYFKPTKTGGIADVIPGPGGGRFGIFSISGERVIFETHTGGAAQTWSKDPLKLNDWNHLVITWNTYPTSQDVNLSLNGVITSRNHTFRANLREESTLRLGANWWYGYAGEIFFDELSVYDKALTRDQMSSSYDSFLENLE